MSMTRKDFKVIAEAIAFTIGHDQSDYPAHDIVKFLIDEVVIQLSRQNPKFDEDKFRDYIEKRAKQVRDNLNDGLIVYYAGNTVSGGRR